MSSFKKLQLIYLILCIVAIVFTNIGLNVPGWRKLKLGDASAHVGLIWGCYVNNDNNENNATILKSICSNWFQSSPGYENAVASLTEAAVAMEILAFIWIIILLYRYNKISSFCVHRNINIGLYLLVIFSSSATLLLCIAVSVFGGKYKDRSGTTNYNLSVSLSASFYITVISIIPNIANIIIGAMMIKNYQIY